MVNRRRTAQLLGGAILALLLGVIGQGAALAQSPAPGSPASQGESGGVCESLARTVAGENANGLVDAVAQAGCSLLTGNPAGAVSAGAGALADAGGSAVSGLAGSAFDRIVVSAAKSFGTAVVFASSLWLKFPTSGLTAESLFARIQDSTMWIQIVLLTASIMITMGRIALSRSASGSLEEAENALRTGAKVVLASSLMAIVVIAGGKAGDAFSQWVVADAAGTQDPLPALTKLTTQAVIMGPDGFQAAGVLVLILSILGILSSLVQTVFIIIRNILLIVVVAVLPMSAAASGMSIGRQSYDKLVGFIIALLLFKPVAALVLAVALWTGQSEDVMQQFMGLILLVLSVLVLPSLMKLIVPAVATAGTGPSTMAVAAGAGVKLGGMVASGGASAAAGGVASGGVMGGGVSGGMGAAAPTPSPPGGGSGAAGGGGTGGGQNRSGGSAGGAGPVGGSPGALVGAGVAGSGAGGGAPGAGEAGGGTHSDQFFGGHVNPTPERARSRYEVEP